MPKQCISKKSAYILNRFEPFDNSRKYYVKRPLMPDGKKLTKTNQNLVYQSSTTLHFCSYTGLKFRRAQKTKFRVLGFRSDTAPPILTPVLTQSGSCAEELWVEIGAPSNFPFHFLSSSLLPFSRPAFLLILQSILISNQTLFVSTR